MILASFRAALGQIGDPRFRRVVLLGVLLAFALLVAVYALFLLAIAFLTPETVDLPLIGPVPDETAIRRTADDFARNDRLAMPLLPGLYLHAALGARGLLWSTLGAELLADLVEGCAPPLEADLIHALAPQRFLRQALRRGRLR